MSSPWSKELVQGLIEQYEKQPCLWCVRSPDYMNKNKKEQAYEELLRFVKWSDSRMNHVELCEIKRKIDTIRSGFRYHVH